MKYGALTFQRAAESPELLAAPTRDYLTTHQEIKDVWVSEIDPSLSDTAAFCEKYEIGMDVSANCVIIEAKRAERTWYAACIILATTRADINGVVRKALDARKVSFAPMETAVSLTNMEYGGITPIGLPQEWPIYIDTRVMEQEKVIVGSGIRGSKILISSAELKSLENIQVMDIVKQ